MNNSTIFRRSMLIPAIVCLAGSALLAEEAADPKEQPVQPKELSVEEMKLIPLREPYKPGWIGWLRLPGAVRRPGSIVLGKEDPAFWASWPKDAPRPMPWVDESIARAKGERPPEQPPLSGLTRLHVLPEADGLPERRAFHADR